MWVWGAQCLKSSSLKGGHHISRCDRLLGEAWDAAAQFPRVGTKGLLGSLPDALRRASVEGASYRNVWANDCSLWQEESTWCFNSQSCKINGYCVFLVYENT